MDEPLSVVIPAYNEESGLDRVLKDIQGVLERAACPYEIIVVDDGSTDKTAVIAEAWGVRVIRHPENIGYGASLKRGILAAKYARIIITDGDGSYDTTAVPELVAGLAEYDMVVGARQGAAYHGTWAKSLARRLFRFLAEFATGRSIPDINSGLRAFRKDVVVRFFEIASNRFSFTTTITLAFMLNGHFVKYLPVSYFPRVGESKIDHFRDTLRAAQFIVQAILYYNPLKLFLLPCSFLLIMAAGLTIMALLTGKDVLLLSAVVGIVGAVIMGGIGLIVDVLCRGRLPR